MRISEANGIPESTSLERKDAAECLCQCSRGAEVVGRPEGGCVRSSVRKNESARACEPPGASRFSTLFNVAAIGGK